MNEKKPKHRAKKSLGQNFLQDQNICRKIVDAIHPAQDDYIIEVGPGQGALTGFLVDAAPDRLAVLEMDDSLADMLQDEYPVVEVIRTDALKYSWASLNEEKSCKIIGNLPYNVGSKLIWSILSTVTSLEKAVFMVQHEVALRLTAEPGTKAYGGLTAWVKNFSDTRYLFKVPPSVFRPQPKVDSAVVMFTPKPIEQWPDQPEKLSKLIKQLFQKRRKQLSTILKKQWTPAVEEWFEREKVDSRARPETLTPDQFASLASVI